MNKISRFQLKHIRDLLRERKARDETGLFVAEGEKIVRDMVSKGCIPEKVILSVSFAENENTREFLDILEARNIPVHIASNHDLDKTSSLKTAQGVLAVSKKKEYANDLLLSKGTLLAVLADGIQDPGNLGAIIRSAAAFGADCVILTGKIVDIYNPKVVRASSGAILDIPVVLCGIPELSDLKKAGYRLLASTVKKNNSHPINDVTDLPARAILAFGSEGKGISEDVLAFADESFYIPISENTESLNVTAAVAISLYIFKHNQP